MSDIKEYTETDLQHALAKEMAKFQVAVLTRDVDVLKQANAKDLTEIKIQIAQVITMIKDQNLENAKDRKEFKAEIERDFASKIDFINLRNELKSLWLRITVTVATLIAMGLFAGWIFGIANSVKGLSH